MDQTFPITAIIINRQPFRESDKKITVFSESHGKMELVARGARKASSKMSGHLEPLTVSNLMVVKGKQFDYVGGAAMVEGYMDLKSDFNKLNSSGYALLMFLKIFKEYGNDPGIFSLTKSYLDILEERDFSIAGYRFITNSYLFNLICSLGYMPELYHCTICRKSYSGKASLFDLDKGGLLCADCRQSASPRTLRLKDESVKLLQVISSTDMSHIADITAHASSDRELISVLGSFVRYHS
jgi:DNA repair protein RecO (recombination protein O)